MWPAIVRGLLQAAAVITLATNSLRASSRHNSEALIGAASVLGSLVLYDLVKNARAQKSRAELYEKENRCRDILSTTLLRIEAITSVPCSNIGMHIYELQRRRVPWRLIRRSGLLRKELVRVSRYRVSALPTASDIRWTKGKGAVGQAWSRATFVAVNLREFDARRAALGEVEFSALGIEERNGFSFAEYRKTVEKYDAVAAVPIVTAKGNVVGCLSVDIQFNAGYKLISKIAIRGVLGDAALVALRDIG